MKKLLSLSVAGSALIAAGCTTAAMASDQYEYREDIHVVVDADHSLGQTVIIRGVDVEVVDGDVIINGDAVRSAVDGRIVISGDNVHVVNGGDGAFAFAFDGADFDVQMADAEAQLENLQGMHIVIDELRSAEMERALAHIEEELQGHHERRMVIINGERREMTDEEREEVRVELAEARDEVRRAMREVETGMRAADEERREAMRVMRIELERAGHELSEANREERRVHVMARHNETVTEDMIRELRENGGTRLRFNIEDGEARVWVDGEELEGDARTDWLNRLQVEELAGDDGSSTRRIVIEIDEDDE
jgi:hypothetical protein